MSRYRARRLTARDGSHIGWCVLEAGGVRMAIGYTGPLARLRAQFRAAVMNRRLP